MHPNHQHQPAEVKQYPELPVANLAPKRRASPLLKILAIIVLVAVVGAGIYVLVAHPFASKSSPTKSTTSSTAATSTDVATHISTATKRYDSTGLYLGFDYPTNWTVNDPGGGKLTVVSPMLNLKSANSQVVKARIVMTIQNQQSTITEFAANSAIAPLGSQKLSYKSPTPGQRAQTYLTPINYAGGSSTIDAFYITGDNGYTVGQYVPMSDVAKDNPLISVSFFGCSDTTCANYAAATSIATNAWADANLSKPIITMLESLQID